MSKFPISKWRRLKCRYYGIKSRIKQRHCEWRYKRVFQTLEKIDKYFPRTSLKEACEHTDKWTEFLRTDAKLCERYRRQVCHLKILLAASGVPEDAVDECIHIDTILGVDALSAILPPRFGEDIINFIIESCLIDAQEKHLMVWSANSASQLRQFVIDQLFRADAQQGGEDEE